MAVLLALLAGADGLHSGMAQAGAASLLAADDDGIGSPLEELRAEAAEDAATMRAGLPCPPACAAGDGGRVGFHASLQAALSNLNQHPTEGARAVPGPSGLAGGAKSPLKEIRGIIRTAGALHQAKVHALRGSVREKLKTVQKKLRLLQAHRCHPRWQQRARVWRLRRRQSHQKRVRLPGWRLRRRQSHRKRARVWRLRRRQSHQKRVRLLVWRLRRRQSHWKRTRLRVWRLRRRQNWLVQVRVRAQVRRSGRRRRR